jgi:hypothetical protein
MKMIQRIQFKVALAAVCILLSMTGCAGPSKEGVSGTLSEGVVSASAEVKAINMKTRTVALQGADGSTFKVHAGEEVRNLAQVKKGDVVTVTYYQSLAYEIKKPEKGKPGVVATQKVARAKPGEKPAAAGETVITITGTITAIDKTAMTVMVRGPKGNTVTVKARDPEKLDRVAVGDLVELTYTEAVAISVETPKKKQS